MKFTKSALLVGVLQLALATGAYAQSSLDAIKSAGVLKIGTEGTYAPFTYHDASGKLVGFDVRSARPSPRRSASKPNLSKASGMV